MVFVTLMATKFITTTIKITGINFQMEKRSKTD